MSSYVSGVANSFSDLKAALIGACTADGWANPATDIVSKGDCFVLLAAGADFLSGLVGLGQTAGTITTPAPATVYCNDLCSGGSLVFPVNYFIHIDGNDVALVANFATDRYMWIMFGQGPVAGLPGTGVWISASNGSIAHETIQWTQYGGSSSNGSGGFLGTGPFLMQWASGRNVNSYVHHGLDGGSWSAPSNTNNSGVAATAVAHSTGGLWSLQYKYGPNAWNGESVLCPVQPYIDRGSSKASFIADLGIVRLLRIDNYAPGDIITLGSDRWRVYPVYKKDAAIRISNGIGTIGQHSGTFGIALRYFGP
jgi:hypothetical protein